jgi:hypothetical protein
LPRDHSKFSPAQEIAIVKAVETGPWQPKGFFTKLFEHHPELQTCGLTGEATTPTCIRNRYFGLVKQLGKTPMIGGKKNPTSPWSHSWRYRKGTQRETAVLGLEAQLKASEERQAMLERELEEFKRKQGES